MTDRSDDRERAEGAPESGLTRRTFLKGAGGVAAGGVLRREVEAGRRQDEAASAAEDGVAGELEVAFELNGAPTTAKVEPRTTLLSALRHHLDAPATGTKEVCDQGNCGACTVLLDDEPVYACMTLAVHASGRRVRTVEGVAGEHGLSTLQQEMWQADASMCGYCTPGFVMSLTACLERNPAASDEALRAACAGNLGRCGTYTHIFEAAGATARKGGDAR